MITILSQTIWFFNLSYWSMTMAIQSPPILPSWGTVIQMTTDICFNLMFHQCLLSDEIVVIVQSLSHVWVFVTPWTVACQDSLSFTISWNLLRFLSLEWWCHPTISSSVAPFSFYTQSFLASGSFPMTLLFASCGQSIGASSSATVLPMSIQGWFSLGLMVRFSCFPCDSQEFSPAPQLESISSLVLSLLYGPTLKSIHDFRKNHSLNLRMNKIL